MLALPAMTSNSTLEALALRRAASRGRGIGLVVALALVHVLMVTPYLEGERRSADFGADRARLEGLAPEIERLGGELETARSEAETALTGALERLVTGVGGDLERLDDARRELARAAEAGPFGLEPLAGPAREAPELAFDLGAPERIADVREAGDDRYALLAALEPVVEERILAPRFGELERLYSDEVEPRLEARLDGLTGILERLRRDFPEGELDAGSLAAALEAARRAAGELEPEPPPEPYWWASPEGSPSFALGLEPDDAERLLRPPGLVALGGELERAQTLQAALAGRLETVSRRLLAGSRRAAELGELGATLRRLGVDPRALAVFFPLVLGLVLSGLLLARGARLAELALAARLARGETGRDLRRLALALLGGTVGGTWRGLGLLALWIAGLAWIAAAAYPVAALDLEPWHRLAPAALGAALLTAAVLYRLIAGRRLAAALDDAPDDVEDAAALDREPRPPAAAGPAALDAVDRDAADRDRGFLDAPLRR